MKTFRELIAWELEQERKQKRSTAPKNAGSELNTTILRKLRYLNSNVSSNDRQLPQNFSAA